MRRKKIRPVHQQVILIEKLMARRFLYSKLLYMFFYENCYYKPIQVFGRIRIIRSGTYNVTMFTILRL